MPGRLRRRPDIERATIEHPVFLYAFDLLGFEGYDLRALPLAARKEVLEEALPAAGPIRFADHVAEHLRPDDGAHYDELIEIVRTNAMQYALAVAAPEVILHGGRYYIASLTPALDGIQIAKLKWVAKANGG